MIYGNNVPLDSETIEILIPCPFQLLYVDKSWSLLKHLSLYVNSTKVNIPVLVNQFDSIGDLFLHIMETDNWYCTLSSPVRAELVDCIQFVFLTRDGAISSHKKRYQYFMQFRRRVPIGAPEISSPFLSELYEKAAASGLPLPTTPSEALKTSEKLKYSSPENSIIQFKDCDELAKWAFEYIINHDRQISRCKTCNRYFIKSPENRKYCSKLCTQASPKTGSHAGESEIKSLYHIIDQRFRRKKNSKSTYVYNGALFDSEYNELELFANIEDKKIKSTPVHSMFNAAHFEQIEKAYKALYSPWYNKVKKAKKAYLSAEISEDEYQNMLRPFLSWLLNVIKQLDAFSIDRHARSK